MKVSVLCLLSFVLSGLGSFAAPVTQGAGPRIEHGPPWLGSDLMLSVIDAPPGVSVRLFESDAAGALATPYGLLELDRGALRVVASGTSDAAGRLDVLLPIPLDEALAETEAHYQALVSDPTAPAGALLSEAVHLRRLGPRLYAGSQGSSGAGGQPLAAGALSIVSALTREVVVSVDYGIPSDPSPDRSSDAQPVFSPDFSRGAVMASRTRLLIFDPFFGSVLASVPLGDASRNLALSADGLTLVVLEPGVDPQYGTPIHPARLHAVDLETGAVLRTRSLPRSSTGQWRWSAERNEVYVIERDVDPAWRHVRRISLQGLQDLGEIPLGGQGETWVTGLTSEGSDLFVATFDFQSCIFGGMGGVLTRIDYGLDPPQLHQVESIRSYGALTPVPQIQSLVSYDGFPCVGPGGRLGFRALGSLGQRAELQLPVDYSDGFPRDIAWDEGRLWLAVPTTYDGLQALLWLDLASSSWTTFPYPGGSGPLQVEIVRDALVQTGAFLSARYLPVLETVVTFVDPLSGAQHSLVVPGRGAESLLGIALPRP